MVFIRSIHGSRGIMALSILRYFQFADKPMDVVLNMDVHTVAVISEPYLVPTL